MNLLRIRVGVARFGTERPLVRIQSPRPLNRGGTTSRKVKWTNAEFNAFLQKKKPTQTVPGGCMTDFYAHEGTGPKSRMLAAMHPDVTRVVYRFGRIHHHVNYDRFRQNRLVRRPGVTLDAGTDDFGMRIETLSAS